MRFEQQSAPKHHQQQKKTRNNNVIVTVNNEDILSKQFIKIEILGDETNFTIASYKPKLGKFPQTDNSWCFLKLESEFNQILFYYAQIIAIEANGNIYVKLFKTDKILFGKYILLNSVPVNTLLISSNSIERQVCHFNFKKQVIVKCVIPHKNFNCQLAL